MGIEDLDQIETKTSKREIQKEPNFIDWICNNQWKLQLLIAIIAILLAYFGIKS